MKKKSQIDVALVIGSIMIPIAALLGSLILAFATVSSVLDLGLLFARISYESVNLVDVVYSVPDNINLYYRPAPERCDLENGLINCDGGTLKITLGVRENLFDVSLKSKIGDSPDEFKCKNFPRYLYSRVTGSVDLKNSHYTFSPIPIKAHADIFDKTPPFFSFTPHGLEISKKRDVHDYSSGKNYNSLYDILSNINELCDCSKCSGSSSPCQSISKTYELIPNYFINVSDSGIISLYYKRYLYKSITGGEYSNKTVLIYQFYLNSLSDVNCTLSFDALKNEELKGKFTLDYELSGNSNKCGLEISKK